MHDQQMSGPDYLEACAARYEAGGFDIEANEMRRRAKEWNGDKQMIENGTFDVAVQQRQQGILVTPTEVDFKTLTIKVQAKDAEFRIAAGAYHLVPVLLP